VVRQSIVVYTEVINFNDRQIARFPNGRLDGTQHCSLHGMTDEKSWIDISCTKDSRVGIDYDQMTLLSPAEPTQMQRKFFELPAICATVDTSQLPQDVTRPGMQRGLRPLSETPLCGLFCGLRSLRLCD
jgi:hypothetical protein